MLSVKGLFEDGVARPSEPVSGREGQIVIITFLEEDTTSPPASESLSEWDTFIQLLEDCIIETGITDLAHQHDHYLYGKPKRD